MNITKEEIEAELKNQLRELLSSGNQEDSILSFKFDEDKMEVNVKLSVTSIPEDNYLGFAGY